MHTVKIHKQPVRSFALATLLLLLAAPGGAQTASRWQLLDSQIRGGDTLLITSMDTTTIRRTGDQVTVWMRLGLSPARKLPWNGKVYNVVVQHWAVSCARRSVYVRSATYRLDEVPVHNSTGTIGDTTGHDIEPDTIAEQVYEIVCKKGKP